MSKPRHTSVTPLYTDMWKDGTFILIELPDLTQYINREKIGTYLTKIYEVDYVLRRTSRRYEGSVISRNEARFLIKIEDFITAYNFLREVFPLYPLCKYVLIHGEYFDYYGDIHSEQINIGIELLKIPGKIVLTPQAILESTKHKDIIVSDSILNICI